jgi:hypothetical protein
LKARARAKREKGGRRWREMEKGNETEKTE